METQKTERVKNAEMMKIPLADLKGKWRLKYTTIGTMGAEGFGGMTLDPYLHPVDGKKVYPKNQEGTPVSFILVDQIVKDYNPATSLQHRRDIEFMLLHPEVTIEGYENVPERFAEAKKGNNRLTLVAMDYQEVQELDDWDFIDKIVGRLSLDGGPKAIGLDRLRYVMAELNLSYRDARFVGDETIEKKSLRKTLKTFTRKSLENARLVDKVIENIDDAKRTFELKEMTRLGIITQSNGSYKYNNIPLGISIDGILRTFEAQPDLKLEMIMKLEDKLK